MGSGTSAPKSEKPKQALVLYMLDPSAPCRCVMMAAALADIDLQYERVNVLEGEQMKKEYLEVIMNRDISSTFVVLLLTVVLLHALQRFLT